MRRLVSVAALVLAASSFAAPKAKDLAKEADRLYKDNKYREAAQKLTEAYELERNPLYLYNIARAWDQAGELQQSLDTYRKYTSLPSDETQPDLVKKANLAMDRLRTLLAKAEADKQVRDAEKQRLEDEAKKERERAEAAGQRQKEQQAAFEAKERARREASQQTVDGRKVGALVAGGVGVAALGTGLALGAMAGGSKAAFTRATTVADKRALESATRTQALVADVCLFAGVAAAIAAVAVFPWGGGAEGSVSVVVSPAPGGAFATVGGRF